VTSTLTLPLTASRSAGALDFDALYRSSRDDIYAYAATLLRDRAAAEDVTAAAFERAYRRQKSFKPDRGSERAWLFGIARHAALDELRRRKRHATLAADPPDTAGMGGDEFTAAVVDRAMLRAALAKLKVRDREIIALRFHAGTTPTNAGTLLHRAMTKLREAIDA
jgi:RNA polymerase sigma factor (sigma-70 family)